MSQHDLSIANQGFPAFRSDLNDALQALGSNNSGATAPSTTYANQLWYDTANNILKIRNEDNDAWISLFTLDQTGDAIASMAIPAVSGNVNFDNSTLYVDATNNRVMVGRATALGSSKFSIENSDTTPASFIQNADTGTSLGNPVSILRNASDGNGRYSSLALQVQNGSSLDQWALISAQAVSGASNYSPNLTFAIKSGASSYSEKMRIDSNGNVLIGSTSGSRTLSVTGYIGAYNTSGSNDSHVVIYNDGTTSNIGSTYNSTGSFLPLAFQAGGSERMRIDSSGNVGIGTTATTTYRTTIANTGGNQVRLYATDVASSTTNSIDFWYLDGGGSPYNNTAIRSLSTANAGNGNLAFYTRPTSGSLTERMRIDSSGNLSVGTTSAEGLVTFTQSDAGTDGTTCRASNATFNAAVLNIRANRNTTNSSFKAIQYYNDGASAYKFIVYDSGNVVNANNSYGAISDIKLKENIVDATPKLEDLCKVQIRNYNLKSDPYHKQLGVIAQELETIFPSMIDEVKDVDENNQDLGTKTKQVKYSVFVPMLIKAVQELKAEVDSLKAQLNS